MAPSREWAGARARATRRRPDVPTYIVIDPAGRTVERHESPEFRAADINRVLGSLAFDLAAQLPTGETLYTDDERLLTPQPHHCFEFFGRAVPGRAVLVGPEPPEEEWRGSSLDVATPLERVRAGVKWLGPRCHRLVEVEGTRGMFGQTVPVAGLRVEWGERPFPDGGGDDDGGGSSAEPGRSTSSSSSATASTEGRHLRAGRERGGGGARLRGAAAGPRTRRHAVEPAGGSGVDGACA